jgi:hypothetical protein
MHVVSTPRVTSVHFALTAAALAVSALFALVACSGGGSSVAPANAPIATTSASSSSSGAGVPADPSTLDAFDRAERAMATAAGDCAAACAALGDIVAARVKLCSPKSDACDDAKTREDMARKTTNETCGECAGSD